MTKKQQNQFINEFGLIIRRLNVLKIKLQVANSGNSQFNFTTSPNLANQVDGLDAVAGLISDIVYQKEKVKNGQSNNI